MSRFTVCRTALFVCDIQERFKSLINGFASVVASANYMLNACQELGIPVVHTEQNPAVMGMTLSNINVEKPAVFVEKMQFSMLVPEVINFLQEKEINDVFLVGIETHVCILQTCKDLLERSIRVHVLVDGVNSQRSLDHSVALTTMKDAGAILTTSESLVYEVLGSASHPSFKAILKRNKLSPLPNPSFHAVSSQHPCSL